jgi:hypothetical protein
LSRGALISRGLSPCKVRKLGNGHHSESHDKNKAGQMSEDNLAGRSMRDEFRARFRSYLFMESWLIESPLSIFTLMMWIEFLSV